MKRTVENLTTKPITEFTPADTIYIHKVLNGFTVSLFGNFVKYERGNVTIELVNVDPETFKGKFPKGSLVTARLANCYLWGQDKTDPWVRCHDFNKLIVGEKNIRVPSLVAT